MVNVDYTHTQPYLYANIVDNYYKTIFENVLESITNKKRWNSKFDKKGHLSYNFMKPNEKCIRKND